MGFLMNMMKDYYVSICLEILFVPGVHVFNVYFISRIRIHVKPATFNQFCSIEFFGPLQSLILLQ